MDVLGVRLGSRGGDPLRGPVEREARAAALAAPGHGGVTPDGTHTVQQVDYHIPANKTKMCATDLREIAPTSDITTGVP